MERDIDTRNGDCGDTAFECGGLGASGSLGDVIANDSANGDRIQGLGSENLGDVGQSVEGLKRAGADVLLELNVVVHNLKERICFEGNQIDQCY